MDSILFIGFLILVFIGIPVILGFLFYFVPKKLGYHKTAKHLTISYGLFVLMIGFYIVFEDQLFTKNQARKLVEEQNLKLTDKFEILNNESMSAIGEYYHTFTLKISEQDKQDAILKIKSADNFKAGNSFIESFVRNKYFRGKVVHNYETEKSFVREYFLPSRRHGYAPIFRRISISKTEDQLVFEDISE